MACRQGMTQAERGDSDGKSACNVLSTCVGFSCRSSRSRPGALDSIQRPGQLGRRPRKASPMSRRRSNRKLLKARSGQTVPSIRAATHVQRPDNATLKQWRHRLKMMRAQARRQAQSGAGLSSSTTTAATPGASNPPQRATATEGDRRPAFGLRGLSRPSNQP